MPGPPRTPTEILKRRGSWLAPLREKQGEPVPPRGRPNCPKNLCLQAKRIWRKLIPLLDEMGVLSRVDERAIARYCQLTVAFYKASDFVNKVGITHFLEDENGKPTGEVETYPQLDKMLSISDRLLKLEIQFGMTPSARARLTVLPKDEDAEIIENKEDFMQLG